MQVSEHLHILKIPFQIPLGPEVKIDRFVNVLLVYGQEGVVLIDSGVAGGEERILSYLEETGRNPEQLKKLVLSHSHPDHVGAAKAIKARTGCAVYAHSAEKGWIEDTDKQFRERPVPGFRELVGGSVEVDFLVNDGDLIEIDQQSAIKVLHTPGHSPGSITLYIPADSAIFTGDAIPVPGDLPIFTDWQTSWESIERIRSFPDVDLLLSSWAEPFGKENKEQVIEAGLDWLVKIKETVNEVAKLDLPKDDPLAICREACISLELPPVAVNPLVAASFASCLETGAGRL